MSSASPLSPVRRIVTGHTVSGQSTTVLDSQPEPYPAHPGGKTLFAEAFWTDAVPCDNNTASFDRPNGAEMLAPSGSSLLIVDTPPGGKAPLHRTITLDYGILISGSLTLILENNERTVLRPGDIVVQRGTLHAWENEGTEWARMYFVLLPAEKVKTEHFELDREGA